MGIEVGRYISGVMYSSVISNTILLISREDKYN